MSWFPRIDLDGNVFVSSFSRNGSACHTILILFCFGEGKSCLWEISKFALVSTAAEIEMIVLFIEEGPIGQYRLMQLGSEILLICLNI
jgi:hypothetical protein